MPKVNKQLAYRKCHQCRKDRQKCQPEERQWPGRRCDRCHKYNYSCSASRTKAEERLSLGVVPSRVTTNEDTPHSELPIEAPTFDASDASSSLSPTHPSPLIDQVSDGNLKLYQDYRDVCQLGYQFYGTDFHDCTRCEHPCHEIVDDIRTLGESLRADIMFQAKQFASQGRLMDAGYAYQKLLVDVRPSTAVLSLSGIELDALTLMSETLNDLSSLEIIRELLLRDRDLPSKEENVRHLVDMYIEFQRRIVKINPGFKSAAKLNVARRVAKLDEPLLNSLAYELGLMTMDHIDACSALHVAAEANACDMAHTLLAKGLHVNDQDHMGWTPLHIAAWWGKWSMVKLLLDNRADVQAEDDYGDNALHKAVTSLESPSVVDLLLDADIDVGALNVNGQSALSIALYEENVDAARSILRRGPNRELCIDEDGETWLTFYASQGNLKLVGLLLQEGMDIGRKNNKGKDALYVAVEERQEAIVEILLGHGADPNSSASEDESPQIPVLHYAIRKGPSSMIEMLLDARARLDLRDELGSTALSEVICSRNDQKLDIMRICLDRTDINDNVHIDKRGRTLLMKATQFGPFEMVRLLLESSISNINFQDTIGHTVVHAAVHSNAEENNEILLCLLDHGAKVNTVDDFGDIALHYAVQNEHLSMIDILITYGADVDVTNNEGVSPRMMSLHNRPEVQSLFNMHFISGPKDLEDGVLLD